MICYLVCLKFFAVSNNSLTANLDLPHVRYALSTQQYFRLRINITSFEVYEYQNDQVLTKAQINLIKTVAVF